MDFLYYDYEIRLHRADGKLSLIAMVVAANAEDAEHQASDLLKGYLTNAYIWRDGVFVQTLYRLH